MIKIVVVYGPTASGKSDLAIKLAKKYNGEIVCADSMQIYKHMNIGTNKPNIEERKQVEHHLFDIIEPDEKFSVAQWVNLAKQKIEEITHRGHLPIICGGTGLYIKALLFPFSFANSKEDEKFRDSMWNLYNEKGAIYLHNILKDKNSELAQNIHPNNVKRVIRYLEILQTSSYSKEQINMQSEYDYKIIYISPEREQLYEKINNRVDLMFSNGLENEVKNVFEKYSLTLKHQSANAIGYKEFFDYFYGKINIETLKALIKQHTRNYAKKQITFAKTFKQDDFIFCTGANEHIDKNLVSFIK